MQVSAAWFFRMCPSCASSHRSAGCVREGSSHRSAGCARVWFCLRAHRIAVPGSSALWRLRSRGLAAGRSVVPPPTVRSPPRLRGPGALAGRLASLALSCRPDCRSFCSAGAHRTAASVSRPSSRKNDTLLLAAAPASSRSLRPPPVAGLGFCRFIRYFAWPTLLRQRELPRRWPSLGAPGKPGRVKEPS